jgi:tetratricopeptide (TPR) repeat protein
VLLGNALGDLGIVSRLTGNHQAAAETQEEALEIYSGLGDQMGKVSALNELGMLSLLRGGLDRAQEYHRLALELARGIKSWMRNTTRRPASSPRADHEPERGSVRRSPSRPAVVVPLKPRPARRCHSSSGIAAGSAGR